MLTKHAKPRPAGVGFGSELDGLVDGVGTDSNVLIAVILTVLLSWWGVVVLDGGSTRAGRSGLRPASRLPCRSGLGQASCRAHRPPGPADC